MGEVMMRARGTLLWCTALLLLLAGMVQTAAPAQAQVPLCLAGEWRMEDPAGLMRGLLADAPEIRIDNVTGEVTLSIQVSGAYELRYNQFGMTVAAADMTMSNVIDGRVRGQMREIAPGTVVGTTRETDLTSTMTVGGETQTIQMPMQDDESGSPVEYDCSLGRITFSFTDGDSGRKIPLDFVRR
jgi:hypothetical protein